MATQTLVFCVEPGGPEGVQDAPEESHGAGTEWSQCTVSEKQQKNHVMQGEGGRCTGTLVAKRHSEGQQHLVTKTVVCSLPITAKYNAPGVEDPTGPG